MVVGNEERLELGLGKILDETLGEVVSAKVGLIDALTVADEVGLSQQKTNPESEATEL